MSSEREDGVMPPIYKSVKFDTSDFGFFRNRSNYTAELPFGDEQKPGMVTIVAEKGQDAQDAASARSIEAVLEGGLGVVIPIAAIADGGSVDVQGQKTDQSAKIASQITSIATMVIAENLFSNYTYTDPATEQSKTGNVANDLFAGLIVYQDRQANRPRLGGSPDRPEARHRAFEFLIGKVIENIQKLRLSEGASTLQVAMALPDATGQYPYILQVATIGARTDVAPVIVANPTKNTNQAIPVGADPDGNRNMVEASRLNHLLGVVQIDAFPCGYEFALTTDGYYSAYRDDEAEVSTPPWIIDLQAMRPGRSGIRPENPDDRTMVHIQLPAHNIRRAWDPMGNNKYQPPTDTKLEGSVKSWQSRNY